MPVLTLPNRDIAQSGTTQLSGQEDILHKLDLIAYLGLVLKARHELEVTLLLR